MKQTLGRKYLALFLLLSICTFSLSGCYNTQYIDKLAYVIALGFDVGENSALKMSFQISIPSDPNSDSSGSSSQSSDTIVNSIECSSIDSGINLINSYISKEINLAHCKAIVFSEELAQQGLADYIYTLTNNIQIRPDTNVIVSRCDAAYFLNNSQPTLEKVTARTYEIVPSSADYTGYTDNIELGDFLSALNDSFQSPSAILGMVNTEETQNSQQEEESSEKDSTHKAGETPIKTKPSMETMGLAVFREDTLVGELNGIETICHLIVTNKLKDCTITIPNPFKEEETIDLNVRLGSKTKNKVDLVNGSPFIHVKSNLSVRVLSVNKDFKSLTTENTRILEDAMNRYMKEKMTEYLYKTSKEYKADIDGFGKFAVSQFLYSKDWKDYDWTNNYVNSFFDVQFDTTLRSGYLMMDT